MFTSQTRIYNNLTDYCESLGIHLTQQGKYFRAHCPLPTHGGVDTVPSFTVYPNDTFFCFGCLEGGGSDRLAFLLKDTPPKLLRKFQRDGDIYARKPATEDQIGLMTRFFNAYRFLSPVVLNYLHSRGFNREQIDQANFGYCTGRKFWIPPKERKTAYLLGLTTSGGWERFRGKILLPEIKDDKVIWIQGRSLGDEMPKYYNVHIQKPLYGLKTLQGKNYTWVVEGIFDALSLHTVGEPAVAIIGSYLQDHQISNFAGILGVKLCFDNDDAGYKSTKHIINQLKNIIPIIQPIRLPKDIKDVNDLFIQGRMNEIIV